MKKKYCFRKFLFCFGTCVCRAIENGWEAGLHTAVQPSFANPML